MGETMKKLLTVILLVSSTNLLAGPQKVTIKEIKAHLQTINPESTCMDEYIARRKQLMIKLGLTPVVAVAGTMGSTYVGGMTGVAIGGASGAEGWSGLGYAIGGAMVGMATGVVAVGVDTTVTAVTLNNIDLILRTLAEYHLNVEGTKSEKLYSKYLKKSQTDLSKEEFLAKLIAADEDGTLCDGSWVKQPKIKIGPKLKFKVAKLKDLVKGVDGAGR
jgi:hypothetical protein